MGICCFKSSALGIASSVFRKHPECAIATFVKRIMFAVGHSPIIFSIRFGMHDLGVAPDEHEPYACRQFNRFADPWDSRKFPGAWHEVDPSGVLSKRICRCMRPQGSSRYGSLSPQCQELFYVRLFLSHHHRMSKKSIWRYFPVPTEPSRNHQHPSLRQPVPNELHSLAGGSGPKLSRQPPLTLSRSR
jgi:hypothetical protein